MLSIHVNQTFGTSLPAKYSSYQPSINQQISTGGKPASLLDLCRCRPLHESYSPYSLGAYWKEKRRFPIAYCQCFFFPALPDKCETWSVNNWIKHVIEIKFPQKKETKQRNHPKTTKQATPTHKPRHGPGKTVREICKLSETR